MIGADGWPRVARCQDGFEVVASGDRRSRLTRPSPRRIASALSGGQDELDQAPADFVVDFVELVQPKELALEVGSPSSGTSASRRASMSVAWVALGLFDRGVQEVEERCGLGGDSS